MAIKRKGKKKATKRKRKVATKKRVIKRRGAKKITKKKLVRKQIKKKKPVAVKKAEGKVVGIVTHYFPNVSAGVMKMSAPLKVGDTIKIKGHTTDFTQTVNSIQIDRVPINEAKKGQEIGILLDSRVRQHDVVYKI